VSDTVTEIPQVITEIKKKPTTTRGGYRPGGGRPRKIRPEKAPMHDSNLPALPTTHGGVTKPDRFFPFWHGLTETQLAQTIVYIQRQFPVCDAKVRDLEAPKYIDKRVGPCPCGPNEWKEWFLKTFGSGDYRLYFNEGSAQRIRVEIEGLRDYDNYPPKIDWETLMFSDPRNKDFVRWARTNGFADEIRRLENNSTPEAERRKEEEGMNIGAQETIRELTGELVTLARESRQREPERAPRTSDDERASVRLIETAATTAIGMVKDQATSKTGDTSPIEQTRAIVDLARTMIPAPTPPDNTIVEILRDSLNQKSEEIRELRHELRERQTNPVAPGTTAPGNDLTTRIMEAAQQKILDQLTGNADKEDDAPARPGSMKAMFFDTISRNAPQIITAVGGLFQSLSYSAAILMKKPGDPTPAPPQAPAPPPPTNVLPTNDDQPDPNFFFRMIEGSVRKHLNEWETRDYPGADFADWLIDSAIDGRMTYEQIKNMGGEFLLQNMNTYPPLAKVYNAMPQRMIEFVNQFIARDEIRKKEEAEEAIEEIQ
jgi:hypothetical protein